MTALGQLFGFGMNGREIYHNFRDGTGDDGKGLYQSAYTIGVLADNYTTRQDSIKDLVVQMESAWDGGAGGAARRGAGPLAVEHGLASPEISTARETLTNQVTVFSGAKKAVVEVPPTPEEPDVWSNIMSFGGANRDYQTSKAEYDAANEQNVSVMEVYEGETDTNTSSMPTTYGSITPDHSGIGVRESMGPVKPLPWVGPNDPGGTDPNGNDTNSNNNNTYSNTNNDQYQNQNQNQNQNNTTNPNNTGGTTNPADRPGTDPRFPPGPVPGPGPGPGNTNNPNNMHPPGFMPGGNPSFGPNGGESGRSGSGYGRGGGFGPGGSGGGPGGSGSGARGMPGGAMPGAAAAAEGAVRPGAGGMRGGAGGMMGGGGMGGGGRGQNGDDDAEHERPSFLVEPDPHSTFGTDEVTAPPVIGE